MSFKLFRRFRFSENIYDSSTMRIISLFFRQRIHDSAKMSADILSFLQSREASSRRAIMASIMMQAAICLWMVAPVLAEPAERTPGCESIAPAQAKLATRLIATLAEGHRKDGGPLIVSPASLASALDGLAHGAEPALRTAMAETLGFAPTGDEAESPFECLRSARTALAQNFGSVVQSADSVIFSQIGEPSESIRSSLTVSGSQVGTDDLSRVESVSQLNAWVKDKTAGLVPAILDGPIPQPGLVALNALHFKAPWVSRFPKHETKPRAFRPLEGKPVQAMMMHLPEGRYAFREDGDFIAIELPFQSERFAMTIVTTRDKPIPASHFTEVADWLNATDFAEQRGDLILPRLSLSAGGDLLPALDLMGLVPARLSPVALSGFGENLTISQVAQRVEIRADEDGAEAAAATAVTTTRSFEGKPLHMVVDKPFIFAVRDRVTGLLLIAGYVPQLSEAH